MKRSKEMVGLDRAFRQVYVGDTIQDALGVKYTITERGTAAGPDGKEVEYHTLHGAELVGATEAKSAPKEAPEAVRSLHAYDDPKIGPNAPRKAPVKREPKQEKKEKKVGTPRPTAGRKNNSGLVRVGNITKAVGYNLGNGTAVLRDAGIEIVKDPVTGTPCVRIQDKDAARELLASLVPPAGAVAIESDRVEITPEGPAVDFDALKEQPAIAQPEPATGLEVGENFALADYTDDELREEMRRRGLIPALRITDPAREFTKADALIILKDEDHVKALRVAGWTVTCTKSI